MKDLSKCDAVIFDVDGTLYDQRSLRRAMMVRFAFAYWKKPVLGFRVARAITAYRNSQEDLRGHPYSAEKQLKLATEKSGSPYSQVHESVAQWMEAEPLGLLPSCTFPGAADLLQKLADHRIPCGIFSDYPAEEKVEAMKLSRFFRSVKCADEVGWLKPDPCGLLASLKEMNAAPAGTLYIGDREIDREAAAQAGMEAVLIRNADTYSELLSNFARDKKT
jgi:HAD superfamily hydrolase (TIGR01549 family)